MSKTLKVVGRAIPTEWAEKTYQVQLREPAGGGSQSATQFGYVHRAERDPKAWVVRTLDGKVFISPASVVNDSRESALWLAEKKLNEEPAVST